MLLETKRSINDRSRCRTDLDTAGMTQIGHGANPGKLDAVLLTEIRKGLCNSRISIAGKIHQTGRAFGQCFPKLFCTDYDPLSG